MHRLPDQSPRYIALHKPYMTLCSFADDTNKKDRATLRILDLPSGMLNVGRLDRDSEGLLLLTDDGAFCHRVLQGDDKILKRYFALVKGRPSDASLDAMAGGGMMIRGRATQACCVRRLAWQEALDALAASGAQLSPPHASSSTAADSTWLEIILAEGMNRQVRRMTAHARHQTVRLVRMGVGALRAECLGLAPGAWTFIQSTDVLSGDDASEVLPCCSSSCGTRSAPGEGHAPG